MEEFVEYQQFSNLNDAESLTNLLETNGITFKIDDSASRYDLSATAINPLENGIKIMVRQEDKDKIDEMNLCETKNEFVPDHYMYSLSDDDIIDAVVNPDGWTKEEQVLAQNIFKQRKLTVTSEIIKASRKDKLEEMKMEETKQKTLFSSGVFWFLLIGVFSFLNMIALITHNNFRLKGDFSLNYFILGSFNGIQKVSGLNLMPFGYFLTFVVSGLFIFIWNRSKKVNKNIYLLGLIIYGIDTLVLVFAKEWFNFAFHIFIWGLLYLGYDAMIKKISNKDLMM